MYGIDEKKIGSTYFNDELVYDGNDLGAVYTKEKTTFRIWTPAAGKVSLNLYEQGDGDNLIETIPMTADVKGTWVCEKTGDLNGVYYTYSVQIGNKVNEVVDLYARSAGVNGNRGEILDLQATDPDGFDADVRPAFNNATDAVIYEVHIRDLSSDASSGILRSHLLAEWHLRVPDRHRAVAHKKELEQVLPYVRQLWHDRCCLIGNKNL